MTPVQQIFDSLTRITAETSDAVWERQTDAQLPGDFLVLAVPHDADRRAIVSSFLGAGIPGVMDFESHVYFRLDRRDGEAIDPTSERQAIALLHKHNVEQQVLKGFQETVLPSLKQVVESLDRPIKRMLDFMVHETLLGERMVAAYIAIGYTETVVPSPRPIEAIVTIFHEAGIPMSWETTSDISNAVVLYEADYPAVTAETLAAAKARFDATLAADYPLGLKRPGNRPFPNTPAE